MDIMKMGKNPNYLGSWDLDELPGRELTLTISRIVDEEVVTSGTKEVCTVCYWTDKEYKPMILNVTNKKMICRLHKTKDTEKLVGRSVVIGVEQVKAFGGVHDALRIQRRIPKVETVKCAECGRPIQGAAGKSADYIIARSKKAFGACLCFECAAARSSAKAAVGVVDNDID